jgi:tetratricopeptide (TPR) repeat protein
MPDADRDSPDARPARKAARPRRPARRGLGSRVGALLAESFPRLTSVLKLARDWTRRKPLWVRLPLYAALAIAVIGYALGEHILALPVIRDLRGGWAAYVEDVFAVPLPKAGGREFAIAVARIEDDDGSIGRSLVLALKIAGVERLQVDRRLRFADAANLDAAEAAAHATARRWLDGMGADLLLWGQVVPGEPKGVRLIMTVRHAEPRHEAPRVALRYLAFNFLEETREPFEAAVQAQVLGVLAQFDPSRAVTEQLRQAIARLEPIVLARREGPGRAALVFALANARATLGEQSGEAPVLAAAVATYRELLSARTRESAPHDWAMTQNNLGNALSSLGQREAGTVQLAEAVAAYRAALAVYDPAKVPLEWAVTQNNLGFALELIARREGDAARLDEAIAAYRAALARFRPESEPVEWAMTRNNLGNALAAAGENEGSGAKLAEAVDVLRSALTVRARKTSPLSWAMTQNNLGNVLAALGERERSIPRLQEAVAAYRAAIEEYPPDRLARDWAMAQSNLGSALGRWGELAGEPARLEEAVTAFRAALTKRDVTQAPLAWAQTQNGLGVALITLGEREKNAARVEEAIRCFEAALAIPGLRATPAYRTQFQNNLFRAQGVRARLAGGAVAP